MKQSIKNLTSGLLILTTLQTNAQYLITKPSFLNYEIESSLKMRITNSLDSLFATINRGKTDTNLVDKSNYLLNLSIINSLRDYENSDSIKDFYKKQLINLYPISSNDYFISIAYIGNKQNEIPVLKLIINLIAKKENEKIIFSIPLKYLTANWKTQTIGNITYYFQGKLNLEVANKFNSKNTTIASKLSISPEKFNFYMCENYQEVLKLLGYEYDLESNGKYKDGYGVDANTIFSIMNSEDFSHDIFHYYSAKIRGEAKRNHTVEEGIAYSWGNAYYTKENGGMIEQKELVQQLKSYLKKNPKISLLELFNKDTKIFTRLPIEVSVKSTISSLLCDEVERKKGIEGIRKLISCGKGDDNFLKTLNELIFINNINFDKEVTKLIEQYK